MKFSREVVARIKDAIEQRPSLTCSLCSASVWELENGFLLFPLQQRSDELDLNSTKALCCIALNCKICGHTVFLNVINLGFTHEEISHIEDGANLTTWQKSRKNDNRSQA